MWVLSTVTKCPLSCEQKLFKPYHGYVQGFNVLYWFKGYSVKEDTFQRYKLLCKLKRIFKTENTYSITIYTRIV